MQNTANITLENWPVAPPGTRTPEPPYHFAIRQGGLGLDFYIRQFYKNRRVSFHYFETFEQLIPICQRFAVSVIIIGGKSDFLREIGLLQTIKRNVFLSIIPVVLFHPEPSVDTMVAAYENGAEEFIHGDWVGKLVEVRLRRVIDRSRRDWAVNPSTMLPGTTIIEQEINRHIDMAGDFAVGYADLDNFKAYNDYYGYHKGDRVVRLTARLLRDIVFDLCPEGFVGHIAGDDFVFIVPRTLVDEVCSKVIHCFDTFIPYRYDQADRERGYIVTKNRRGETEQFPLLTISIAVLTNENGKFTHVGEMARMLADLKKATKMKPGSNYMIERRRKY